MVVFPNCKINLGLRIGSKRLDGFHNLETIFFPLPLKDILEIIPGTKAKAGSITFTSGGFEINGNAADNLCVKAYQLLLSDFPQLPPVTMHLHKAIPMGAGLGGGSADAAFTLKLLNDTYKLNLSQQQLIRYSLLLGSDCPFFIINKPALATGRGEILTPLELNLNDYQIVLINPGIHINTGWAFGQLNRGSEQQVETEQQPLNEIVGNDIEYWKDELVNDFEAPVFESYPQLQTIKTYLYKQGAVFAAMSGSGSTLFGIFKRNVVPVIEMPSEYYTSVLSLGDK